MNLETFKKVKELCEKGKCIYTGKQTSSNIQLIFLSGIII